MRQIRFIIFSLLIVACSRLQAQDTLISHYGKEVSEGQLRENLTILASDFMEGRETGKRGQRMAASFIRAHFSDNKLVAPVAGDYLQPLELYRVVSGDNYVQVGNVKYDDAHDVAFIGLDDSGGETSTSLVFIGNGDESAYQQVDVHDKAVLLFSKSSWAGGSKEVMLAREKGAKMVFVCNSETQKDFDKVVAQGKRFSERGRLSLEKPDLSQQKRPGLFVVSPHAVEAMMGSNVSKLRSAIEKKSLKKVKPVSIRYKTSAEVSMVPTENVLGLVEGSDKKNEILLVTAHYDHVGIKTDGTGDLIHNGADDDGSGTVAVMELARVFAKARREGHGPRRSILFMLVTGEESGLLGSEFYAENPVFSLESTVADLNIDMIGRRDPKHKEGNPYLYVIGADKLSSELNEISERMNATYNKLDFDYTYNDPAHPDRLYYRSDHWNFARRNVPIIFYFDGIHEDYHKVTDEVSKIDFGLLRLRAQCIFYTAWELANRENRITIDKTSGN
jgi:hypothetical protein